MNGSGIFRLGWADLARGLVLAMLTAVLTSAQQAWSNNIDPATWSWKTIGGVALGALIAYLLKNLASDQDGKVLGKIGAVLLLVLAGGALGGCSSLWSGVAIGGAGGFDGPGAAGVKVTGCDISAQGSIPLTGVDFACSTTPDGGMQKTAKIQSANPETILLESMKAQAAQAQITATLLQQILPLVAQAAATAAGGPAGGAIAGALIKPPVVPPPAVPLLPTLPGPAAQ